MHKYIVPTVKRKGRHKPTQHDYTLNLLTAIVSSSAILASA